jgi:hypothetical protein
LNPKTDPAKRALLDNLPRLITGFGRTPGVDAAIVVVDTDNRDCREFLAELKVITESCNPRPEVMIRLAVEEIEAWFLGDQAALLTAYPKANRNLLQSYKQDSICGTWETLADVVKPNGAAELRKLGFPASVDAKHEWAENIGPHLGLDRNASPSFNKFVQGLRRLAATG